MRAFIVVNSCICRSLQSVCCCFYDIPSCLHFIGTINNPIAIQSTIRSPLQNQQSDNRYAVNNLTIAMRSTIQSLCGQQPNRYTVNNPIAIQSTIQSLYTYFLASLIKLLKFHKTVCSNFSK